MLSQNKILYFTFGSVVLNIVLLIMLLRPVHSTGVKQIVKHEEISVSKNEKEIKALHLGIDSLQRIIASTEAGKKRVAVGYEKTIKQLQKLPYSQIRYISDTIVILKTDSARSLAIASEYETIKERSQILDSCEKERNLQTQEITKRDSIIKDMGSIISSVRFENIAYEDQSKQNIRQIRKQKALKSFSFAGMLAGVGGIVYLLFHR